MRNCLIVFVLLSVVSLLAMGQSIPIFVHGSGPGAVSTDTATIVIGNNGSTPANTYAPDIDVAWGPFMELLSPPAPPAGWDYWVGFFDIPSRGNNTPAGPNGPIYTVSSGTGMTPMDFRGTEGGRTQIDSFLVRVTGNNVQNSDVVLSWGDVTGKCDSIQIKKKVGANYNRVGVMTTASSYTEDNSAGSLTFNYLLIKTGVKGGSDVKQEVAQIPTTFNLGQNYPNPFNPTTEFSFTVAKKGYTTLRVFNTLGQEVMRLFDGIAVPGTVYKARLDGKQLATGVYIYQLSSEGKSEIKKMVLLK